MAGEKEARGRHVAVAQALGIGVSAMTPLLAALAITGSGFMFYALCLMPLIGFMLFVLGRCRTPPVTIASWKIGKTLAFNTGAKIQIAESAAMNTLIFTWMFVVYFYGGGMVTLGGVLTLGIMAQILWQLVLGHWVDRGHGVPIAHAGGSAMAMVILGRALLPLSMPVILFLEGLSAFGSVHENAARIPVVYNAGKDASDPMWYWLFAETGWDIGAMLGVGSAALLLWLGAPLQNVLLIALPPALIAWWLVQNYYKTHGNVKPEPHAPPER